MKDFASLVDKFLEIINLAIPVVFAITILIIIWKVTKAWIIGGGDPSSIEAGKRTLFAAVVALTIMASIWGIVKILQTSLSLGF